MASLDFPSTPANNQVYTLNGVQYYYNGVIGAWLTNLITNPLDANTTNTQIFFNDAGYANGNPNLRFDKLANTLYVSNVAVAKNVTAAFFIGDGSKLTGIAVATSYDTANAAYGRANTSAQLAFRTIAITGNTINASSNAATLTIGNSNNIVVLSNTTNSSLQITQNPSGVTPSTYGGTTAIPVIVIDAFGRVTAASNAAAAQQGVTSLSADTGITLTPNPITSTGTIGLAAGVITAQAWTGGISALTTDNYGRVTSVTASAGYLTSLTGTAGQIFRSTGSAPTINLISTGVTASTYGGASFIPVLNVDAFGRITGASNVAVQGMDYAYVNTSTTAANNYAGSMANSGNSWAQTIVDANLVTARAYTNTSTTAANNYAGVMANSGNSWTQTIVDANLVTARAYTNTSTTAANNYAGVMANGVATNAAAAFARGNTSAQLAFFRVAANGTNLDAVSNADTLTIRSSNNIVLIANSTNDSIQITQSPSGVTATTYGGTTNVPVLTVDAFGRITSASNAAISASGGSSVAVSDTAPGSPTANSLWWSSSVGRLFIYYNDGNSSQWVDAAPANNFPTHFVGTTSIALNRTSAPQTLTGVSIDGNAGTATTLATPRTLTIGSTGKSFDGSAAVSWSLAEIGAAAVGATTYIGTTAIALNRTSAAQALTGITSIDGTANNSTYLNGNNAISIYESLRANRSLTGGGLITVDASYNVLWGTRFIVISSGFNPNFSTNGYYDITCPTTGTITGVGGAANKTATAAGIPLAAWEAIYYILPVGSTNASVAANFRVASYTSALDIPYDWLLICVRNGDDGLVYFNNGRRLTAGQSIASGATSGNVGPGAGSYSSGISALTLDAQGRVTAITGSLLSSTTYIGTTAIALNRTSAAQALTGITSIDGSSASCTGSAAQCGGFTPSQTSGTASRIVVADASGYIINTYFNSTDDASASNMTYVIGKFGDNFHRSGSAERVGNFLARNVAQSLPAYRLNANLAAFGPAIGDFFGATSSINLAATSHYNIEIACYFTKTTAGTATWTPVFSSAPRFYWANMIATPIAAFPAGVFTAPQNIFNAAQNSVGVAFTATGSLTTAVNHLYVFKFHVATNLATTFKMRLTQSAGTATPLAGSYYVVTPVTSAMGSFA